MYILEIMGKYIFCVFCIFFSLTSSCKSIPPAKIKPKIAIIGAGLAGLTMAYELDKFYDNTQIYEASNQIGGRIQTIEHNNVPIETGGTFINSDHSDLINLAKELNVSLTQIANFSNQSNSSQFEYLDTYFFDRFWSESDFFQMFLATLVRLDVYKQKKMNYLHTISLKKLFQKIEPHPLFSQLIELVLENEYGISLDKTSANTIFDIISYNLDKKEFNLMGGIGDMAHIFTLGAKNFLEKIKASIRSPIHLNHVLYKVKKNGQKYTLYFHTKTGDLIQEVDILVLSLSPNVLRKGNVELKVNMPKELTKFIADMPCGTNQKIFLYFDKPLWEVNNGKRYNFLMKNFWIWENGDQYLQNSYHSLTAFTGGNSVNYLKINGEDKTIDHLLNHLSKKMPTIRQHFLFHYVAHDWGNKEYFWCSYGGVYPPNKTHYQNYLEKPYFDNIYFIGTEWTDNFASFMNGSVYSAKKMLEVLRKKL